MATETRAGWRKSEHNPVLGGELGTCFDIAVLPDGDGYRMYFSWRPQKSIAVVTSDDGVRWTTPTIVLSPTHATTWEQDINRPAVLTRHDGYHMWYTGQSKDAADVGRSAIGYATSLDGVTWERTSAEPVLAAGAAWEKVAVMCPHVIWDDARHLYYMWYSGGEQYEPDAIGYATSTDGRQWTKYARNPIFQADPDSAWEQHKVTACQVVRHAGWYNMFYVGFRDIDHAQIGLARSRDGISGWQRHSLNPIISPGVDQWDHDACYKPFALLKDETWRLWYNGRHDHLEQIGLALHDGQDLGF